MKSVWTALVMILLTALLAGCGGGGSSTPPPSTTAFPDGDVYLSAQSVTLQVAPGAVTYYTLDGSTPTESSARYTGPISVAATGELKFFSVDPQGNRESVKTERYLITGGALLRISATGGSQQLSGVRVELTLPAGVGVATNGDGSVADGVVSPSANTFGSGSVLSFPGALSYDPVGRVLSFYLVSSAAGGFGSGEFAAVAIQPSGTLPDAGAFSAILASVDLQGNVLSSGAPAASFQVEQ